MITFYYISTNNHRFWSYWELMDIFLAGVWRYYVISCSVWLQDNVFWDQPE